MSKRARELRRQALENAERRKLQAWALGAAEELQHELDAITDTREPEVPQYTLPAKLSDERMKCRFCGSEIIWGTTHKGRRAPFDASEPHQNHWATCANRKSAEKALKGR